jgi:hypothetical protein
MTVTTYYATAVGAQHAGATYTDSESDGDDEGLIYQAYESDPRDGYLYPFLSNFPTSRRGSSGDDDYDDGSETTILSLRGEAIEITKRELAQLPDSIIIGLSNSIVMPENDEVEYGTHEYYETCAGTGAGATAAAPDFGAEAPMVVDYSPACLRYILEFYREAAAAAASSSSSLLHSSPAGVMAFDQPVSSSLPPPPSMFLLREDLEYYCIPTRPNLPPETLNYIKHECGLLLLQTDGVFSGFRDCDDDKEAIATVPAAAVLEDARVRAVLMRNGVGANAVWGVREMEPGRTMISSLLLVRLEEEGGDDGSGNRTERKGGVIAGSASSLNLAATGAAADTIVAPADQSIANDSKSSVTISNISNSISGSSTSKFDTKAQETATLLVNDDEMPTKNTQKDDIDDDDENNNNNNNNNDSIYKSHPSHLSNKCDHDRHDHIRDSNYADAEEEEDDDEKEDNNDDDSESVAFLPLVAATDLTGFRRKPARRCWWSKFTVEDVDGYGDVTLHVRKVWVLEVCGM